MCRSVRCLAALPLMLALASCSSRLPYEGKTQHELERMLKDDDPKVQAQGAYGLSLDRAKASAAAPALIEAMNSPHASVREKAARALAAAGPAAAAAVPALMNALEDPDWTVQRQAALALGEIGSAAAPAVPALEELGNSTDKPVREAARQALAKIEAVQP
jgi:HEAT repeat protein